MIQCLTRMRFKFRHADVNRIFYSSRFRLTLE